MSQRTVFIAERTRRDSLLHTLFSLPSYDAYSYPPVSCSTMRIGEPEPRMNIPQAHDPSPNKNQIRILVQAAVCEEKKGQDTRILELDPADSGLSDFFLITSALNDRQAMAISDEIELRLKREFGVYANSVEGRRNGEWILLDYVDFVVHVFLAERRAFYDIERLRKSARPLTPPEFDAELKSALAEKTRAVRVITPAKTRTAAASTAKNLKPPMKPAAPKRKAATEKKAKARTGPRKAKR